MSVRRFRVTLAILALTIPILTACTGGGGKGGEAAPSADGAPVTGGSLVFATNVEPPSLDVTVVAADISAVIGRHLFDSLLSQGSDGAIRGGLAASYEVNADTTAYTFRLRDGVTFSDGTPLNAEAVAFNFNRVVDPKTGSLFAASLLGPYTGTTVQDPLNLTVNFSKPYAPFAQAATQAFLGIQSPTAIRAGRNPATQPVGSGPFVLKSFTPGQGIVMTRREDYNWAPETAKHSGRAHLDTLEFRVVAEDQVRVGLLGIREADVIGVVPPLSVDEVKGEGNTVISANGSGVPWLLGFNTDRAPFDDVNMRRAIQAAVDLDPIVKSVYVGQYDRAWSPLAPSTFGYDKSLEGTWGGDANAANGLLDAAGWSERGGDGIRVKNGQRLEIKQLVFSGTREQRNEVLTLVQAQLRKVGADLKLLDGPVAGLAPLALSGEYDMYEGSFVSGDPAILGTLFSSANITDGKSLRSNLGRIDDPEVDRLIAAGAADLDRAKRAQAYAELQQRLVEQAYVIPVYVSTYTAASRAGVHDVAFGAQTDVRFYDAWIER